MFEDNDFIENISLKLNSNMTTYSISAFNDNASTYMGVKSVNEEQTITTNKNQKDKNKKIKKENSFSSITESSDLDNSDKSSKKNKSSNKISKKKKIEKEKNNEKNNGGENNKQEKEKEIEKIKTLFEWDGGGEIVYLTGSFCNWKQFFKMEKNENNGKFSLFLNLPRGFHQYKFKVDENWEFSKNFPKFEENGNINNYIDTTDYQIEDENKVIEENNKKNNNNNRNKSNEKEEKKEIEKTEEKNNNKKLNKKSQGKKNKKNKKRLSSTHSVNFLNSQNNYTIYYPLKSELNIKPSTLPSLYKAHFILKEDFKPKKERRFTKVEYINDSSSESSESSSSSSSSETSSEPSSKVTIFGEIIPYVKFQNLYHIHSNHLHSKMYNYKHSTVSSMTSRYRIKFTTFIYYKPYTIKEIGRTKHSKTVKMKVKKKIQKKK